MHCCSQTAMRVMKVMKVIERCYLRMAMSLVMIGHCCRLMAMQLIDHCLQEVQPATHQQVGQLLEGSVVTQAVPMKERLGSTQQAQEWEH